MADPQPNAAAVTPAQPAGPAQPAAAQVDDGFERISRDELTTLRRNNERVRGMEPFFQKANQLGLKRIEDLDGIGKFNSVLDKKGIKRDALMQALMAEEQDTGGEQPQGGLTLEAIEKQLGPKFMSAEKFEAELNKRDAMYAHKSAMVGEQSAVQKTIDGLIAKLGEGASARDKALLPSAFKAMLAEKRGLYPDEHPLSKEQLAPFDEKSLGALAAEFEKSLGLADAQAVAALGDETNKGGRKSTVAGSSTTTTTKPPNASESDMRSGGRPSVAAVEAAYAKRVARRNGGTMSSMGGG